MLDAHLAGAILETLAKAYISVTFTICTCRTSHGCSVVLLSFQGLLAISLACLSLVESRRLLTNARAASRLVTGLVIVVVEQDAVRSVDDGVQPSRRAKRCEKMFEFFSEAWPALSVVKEARTAPLSPQDL